MINSTLYVKYVAKYAKLCDSIIALVIVLKGTRVSDVDAVIRHNAELISKLQEVQRALIFFKNAKSETPYFPKPPDPNGAA